MRWELVVVVVVAAVVADHDSGNNTKLCLMKHVAVVPYLRAIRVRACISHGQVARPTMLDIKVFILQSAHQTHMADMTLCACTWTVKEPTTPGAEQNCCP